MKKIYLLLTSLLMMGSATSYGQDYYDIAAPGVAEIVDLYWHISGDTTDTGDRVSDNRVYRLERGGRYLMKYSEPFDFSFAIIAGDATDTGDGSGRPPVIERGRYESGDNLEYIMNLDGDNNRYYFENIVFSGIDIDGLYEAEYNRGIQFKGSHTRIEFKDCVFNAWNGGAVLFSEESGSNTIYFSDNSFRNGHFITHPFGGQQTGFTVSQDQDTIVFTNNTYINNTSYFVFQGTKGQSKVGYMLFEHNTVFGSLVNTLMIDDMVNAHLNSNIFYAEAVFGNTDKSTANNWYTDNGDPLSTMFFSPTGFGVEADRILEVKNNTYFQPHYVIDYHAAYPEITTGVFMGPKTKAMFNDKAAYPLLSMSGNVDKDPKFKNIDVEDYVSEEIVFSAKTSYDSRTGTGWGVAPYRRNLDEDLTTVTDVAMFDWPLIEGNLEIEDESLITGGHDGLPVGNLNWNASKRSQYKYPNGVGGMLGLSMFGGPALSNDEVGFANKGYELSSFPNPAVETATITFKLPKKSNVIISVYNTMGQQIAVLANSSFAKGSHNVVWDASNVASGLYIYKLETEEVSQAHQIIITK